MAPFDPCDHSISLCYRLQRIRCKNANDAYRLYFCLENCAFPHQMIKLPQGPLNII